MLELEKNMQNLKTIDEIKGKVKEYKAGEKFMNWLGFVETSLKIENWKLKNENWKFIVTFKN